MERSSAKFIWISLPLRCAKNRLYFPSRFSTRLRTFIRDDPLILWPTSSESVGDIISPALIKVNSLGLSLEEQEIRVMHKKRYKKQEAIL